MPRTIAQTAVTPEDDRLLDVDQTSLAPERALLTALLNMATRHPANRYPAGSMMRPVPPSCLESHRLVRRMVRGLAELLEVDVLEVFDGLSEHFLQRNFWLPVQILLRKRDVRPPLAGVISGTRQVHNL